MKFFGACEGLMLRRLLWLAFGFRVFVALLTPVPSQDGTNYLWMAERLADFDASAALSEVFPPGLPLVIAPFLWLGLDPFRTAQIVLAALGALALVPMIRSAGICSKKLEICAGCMMVIAPLPVRYVGEVYTEPLFHLAGAWAFWAGLVGRPWLCGVWTGAAFWIRPEAALIALVFALLRPRKMLPALVPVAVAVLGLATWRWSAGQEFTLVAKWGFNQARLWGEQGPGVGHWLLHLGENLVQIPWLWVEAFGLVGLLAVYGLWRARGAAVEFRPHLLLLVLAVLVIASFLARRRFLVTWAFVLAPLAAYGLRSLPRSGRWPTLFLVFFSSLLISLRVTNADRYAERVLGDYARAEMEPGERVESDLGRVHYFAGQRPFAPRRFTAEELIERFSAPEVRFVVLKGNAPYREEVERALDGFQRARMPNFQLLSAQERGLIVLERR